MKKYAGFSMFLDNFLKNNAVILMLYPCSYSFNKHLNTCLEPGILLDTKNTDTVPPSKTLHTCRKKMKHQQVQKHALDHSGSLHRVESRQMKPVTGQGDRRTKHFQKSLEELSVGLNWTMWIIVAGPQEIWGSGHRDEPPSSFLR